MADADDGPTTHVVMLSMTTMQGEISLIVIDELPLRAEAIAHVCRNALERELSHLRPDVDAWRHGPGEAI